MNAPAIVRAHVFVSGRVQGVFFRDHLRGLALDAGVAGWVRNLADGRVEAELEGGPEQVERLVRWCHSGPPRARVTAVNRTDRVPSGEQGFQVR